VRRCGIVGHVCCSAARSCDMVAHVCYIAIRSCGIVEHVWLCVAMVLLDGCVCSGA
jgi:hypothetical protein